MAIFSNGRAEVLTNELGQSLVPSVVALGDDDVLLVGAAAAEVAVRRPEQAAARFKPDMATERVRKLGEREMTPVALSALILRELKAIAEKRLQAPVTHTVITVPAWFREPQRAATVEAAQVAGLHIDRVLNEPTAAA
ncbi:MAG: Hsp70 family protein, partial [Myxococcota bacterium]